MSTDNFIDARKLNFKPFQHPLHPPDETGDSGSLEFAVSKTDADEQYIVKRGDTYPEIACNEFMYHKVASALGMYTQDVKLISGNKEYHRAAAIRYVPNAREYDIDSSTEENLRAFLGFEALYVILNEDDSHEYYLDERGLLFKLDNAASFTVQQTTIMLIEGNPIGRFFIPDINNPLNAVGYDYYNLMYDAFLKKHGKGAVEAYLSAIRRFAELDETVFYEAYGDLEKLYPQALGHYYNDCIRIRKDTCRKFLTEIGKG